MMYTGYYIQLIYKSDGTHLIQMLPYSKKMVEHIALVDNDLNHAASVFGDYELIVYTDFEDINKVNWHEVQKICETYVKHVNEYALNGEIKPKLDFNDN